MWNREMAIDTSLKTALQKKERIALPQKIFWGKGVWKLLLLILIVDVRTRNPKKKMTKGSKERDQ